MSIGVGLEIALAMAVLFWMLASVASFLVEALNSLVINVRARALERFVCEMVLGEHSSGAIVRRWYGAGKGRLAGLPLADPLGLLSHGLVRALHKPGLRSHGEGRPPSYIPASVFAKALLDRLGGLAAWAAPAAGAAELGRRLAGPGSPLPEAARQRVADAGAEGREPESLLTLAQALAGHWLTLTPGTLRAELGALRATLTAPGGASPDAAAAALGRLVDAVEPLLAEIVGRQAGLAMQPLAAAAGADPAALLVTLLRGAAPPAGDGLSAKQSLARLLQAEVLPVSLQQALRAIAARTGTDAEALSRGIEDWYDEVMQRASSWFRERTTVMLGGVGLVLAMLLNVNPFLIFGELARDPALRAQGVALAEEAVERGAQGTLVQQGLFVRASESLQWKARLDQAELPDATLRTLAVEMAPLLLGSAHYVGFVPGLLFTAADTSWSADEEQRHRRQLCRAHLSALGTVEPTRIAEADAGHPGCKGLFTSLAAAAAASASAASAPQAGAPAVAGASAAAAARAFWRSPLLQWNPALSADLHAAVTADAASRGPALDRLRTSFNVAFDDARRASGRASDFVNRLDSVGGKPLKRWDRPAAESRRYAWSRSVLLDIVGFALTALLVSFGAPFWFDLMGKLIDTRRVTGPRPPIAKP